MKVKVEKVFCKRLSIFRKIICFALSFLFLAGNLLTLVISRCLGQLEIVCLVVTQDTFLFPVQLLANQGISG